jgi:hypothetical protein
MIHDLRIANLRAKKHPKSEPECSSLPPVASNSNNNNNHKIEYQTWMGIGKNKTLVTISPAICSYASKFIDLTGRNRKDNNI